MAVYNISPEFSDLLDDWQIKYLDAYRIFNFNGRFIYFEDRAWEILEKKKAEMSGEVLWVSEGFPKEKEKWDE